MQIKIIMYVWVYHYSCHSSTFFFYFLLGNLAWMAVTQTRPTNLRKLPVDHVYHLHIVHLWCLNSLEEMPSPFNFHTIIYVFFRKVKVMSTFKKICTNKFPQSTSSVIQKSVWYLPLAMSFPSTTWLREVQGVIESEFLTFFHAYSFIQSVSHDL